jgi:tRNA threonylcarbamoyladenosine biosynthesis protein TsaE
MMKTTRYLAGPVDTLATGSTLAPCIRPGMVFYLQGDLGAGKTTLVRGVLRGLGYAGKVKSPTFSLVELYEFSRLYFYHFDFYRIDRPQEWQEAGFREYFNDDSVCLVEWPEKAGDSLPSADVKIELKFSESGRVMEVSGLTDAGAHCAALLRNDDG